MAMSESDADQNRADPSPPLIPLDPAARHPSLTNSQPGVAGSLFEDTSAPAATSLFEDTSAPAATSLFEDTNAPVAAPKPEPVTPESAPGSSFWQRGGLRLLITGLLLLGSLALFAVAALALWRLSGR